MAQPAPGVEPLTFEARLYESLFTCEDPAGSDTWLEQLNPASLTVLTGAYGNPGLAAAKPLDRFQFERLGYFCLDTDSKPGALIFNRTVTLKESAAGAAFKK